VIVNENIGIINETYRHIYNTLKYKRDGLDIIKSKKKIRLKIKRRYNTKKIDSVELSRIELLPHAQKKCSKHKKVVYIEKDYVYKGPYYIGEKSFENSMNYSNVLDKIERLANLPNFLRSSIRGECLLENEETCKIFIMYENVGNLGIEHESQKTSTKLEINVDIFDRNTFVKRISDMDDNEINDQIKLAVLQHLYYRYLLNIGDSGLHNILLRDKCSDGKLIAGIDMDEMKIVGAVDKSCSGFDLLFKNTPGERVRALLESKFNSIQKLVLTDELVKVLRQYNVDVNLFTKRLKKI